MSTPDKEENHLCKIVGISGSVRPDSYTTRAVALAFLAVFSVLES
jgi:hypothetical protein